MPVMLGDDFCTEQNFKITKIQNYKISVAKPEEKKKKLQLGSQGPGEFLGIGGGYKGIQQEPHSSTATRENT